MRKLLGLMVRKLEQPGSGWLVLLLSCFLLTGAMRWRTAAFSPSDPGWAETVDIHKYLHMAQSPLGSFHIQPSCWRIGVPFLVSLLPMDAYSGFDLLSVCFVALTGWMIYYWLRAMSQSGEMALLGVALYFSLGSVSKLLLWGVASPDSAAYFLQVVLLYAIYTRKDLLFAVTLLLGVCVKETVAFMGLLFYTLQVGETWLDARLIRRTLLVGLPALAALVAIRVFIPAYNNNDAYVAMVGPKLAEVATGTARYSITDGFAIVAHVYAQMSTINLVRTFTYSFLGIHFFLTLLGVGLKPALALRWSPFLLLTGFTFLVALNPERRMGSLFPFLILACLAAISYLARRLRIPVAAFTGILAVETVLLLSKRDVLILPADISMAVFILMLGYALMTPASEVEPIESRATRTVGPLGQPNGESSLIS